MLYLFSLNNLFFSEEVEYITFTLNECRLNVAFSCTVGKLC